MTASIRTVMGSLAAAAVALPLLALGPVASAATSAASSAVSADISVRSQVSTEVPASLPSESAAPSQDAPASGILSTVPASGEKLGQAPSSVSVLMTSVPVESSMTVIVKDAKGKQWDQGYPALEGSTMEQPIDPNAPAGAYTVFWAYTSASGEYFQGQFSYRVTGSGGAAAGVEESAVPQSKTDAENQAVEAAGQAQAQAGQISTLVAVLIGLAVIAVLIVGLSARKRITANVQSGSSSEQVEDLSSLSARDQQRKD